LPARASCGYEASLILPGAPCPPSTLTHLRQLEAESIHILREVVAEFENPVMLYSIGKDSAVMLRLAQKAFYPGKLPFPLLHVDTTWKFRAMIEFPRRASAGERLRAPGAHQHRARGGGDEPLRSREPEVHHDDEDPRADPGAREVGLRRGLRRGAARRGEERAKERVYSFRDKKSQWDPKNQRPELWNLYNGKINKGESIRVFPLSNWTELDVWQYIHLEDIPIVPLYFAAKRPVVERDGADHGRRRADAPAPRRGADGEVVVRFRTLGCYPLTGAIESTATTLPEIIREMLLTKHSERQGG
jgi:sulfate adenylyltransferase subunit 2